MSGNATRIITDAHGAIRRQIGAYRLDSVSAGIAQEIASPRFRIGSAKGNDLSLSVEGVSRYHVEICADEAGYFLRDLGSTNGTFIDGIRVKEAYLPARAELRLGNLALDFSLTGASRDVAQEESFAGVVGRSPAMREIFSILKKAAPSDATVLIEGESGTGKEMIAAALHRSSGRAGGPLVVFDCAAVPASLVESELFGHERGAFTGADSAREGRFEEADGGTLFLDELGELPLDLQPKLLRVLESREVRRIGSKVKKNVDVRLVAATNRDLAVEVNRGSFRADLYYRLAVVELRLPPLRERPEDIRPLVEFFIRRALQKEPARAQTVIEGISEQNWTRICGLPWRGNVRELKNFIERTLVLSDGPNTTNMPRPKLAENATTSDGVDLELPFSDAKAQHIESFERAYLLGQLAAHQNNISAAARASGLDRMNFKRLMKKYR